MNTNAESLPDYSDRENGTYGLDGSGPKSPERGEMPGNTENNATDRTGGTSRQASYALALQKACDTALTRIKSSNIIANSKWASPLATAPSAISIMAVLFKVADKECAAGLEVESQDVMDAENNIVKGKLPSKYFHTNLQHCGDVGRLAFLDAQHGMNAIQATARSLIAEQGSISAIIDLLEDPEDARFNLKAEIEAVKRSAKKCLDSAAAITSKFAYWHLVIMHLKQTSLTKRGEVIKEKDVTATRKANAQQDAKKYQGRQKVLEDQIISLQRKLQSAERDVDRAQDEVDWLREQPIQLEPSALEDLERVAHMIPDTSLPTKGRGLFNDIRAFFQGEAEEHIREDEDAQSVHSARIRQLRDEALTRVREQRNHERQLAANRLKEARELEDKTKKALNAVYQELANSKYQLAQAKSDYDRTNNDLILLSNKAIQLQDIMTILDNSTTELGKLKNQVEPLVDFFKDILQGISHTVDEDLQSFLRPIENGITVGSSPEEVKSIRVSQASKKRIMSSALQMQGRFSAIVDISGAYIQVSKDYIRPAITRMEELSTLPESEWLIRSQEFSKWCNDSISDIDRLAQETSQKADLNMKKSLDALHRRAIEAAAGQEE